GDDAAALEPARALARRTQAADAPEAGQWRAEAEVDARTEAEMMGGVAGHVEAVGIRVVALVAIGRAEERRHARALRHGDSCQLHLARRPPVQALEGRVVAQRLLEGGGHERHVMSQAI